MAEARVANTVVNGYAPESKVCDFAVFYDAPEEPRRRPLFAKLSINGSVKWESKG